MEFNGKPISRAVVNIATIARHEIVAATSGQRIHVFALWLWANGTTNATFESATTALAGPLSLIVQSYFDMPFNRAGEPYLVTTVSEAFNISLSAAQQVSGVVYYVKN